VALHFSRKSKRPLLNYFVHQKHMRHKCLSNWWQHRRQNQRECVQVARQIASTVGTNTSEISQYIATYTSYKPNKSETVSAQTPDKARKHHIPHTGNRKRWYQIAVTESYYDVTMIWCATMKHGHLLEGKSERRLLLGCHTTAAAATT